MARACRCRSIHRKHHPRSSLVEAGEHIQTYTGLSCGSCKEYSHHQGDHCAGRGIFQKLQVVSVLVQTKIWVSLSCIRPKIRHQVSYCIASGCRGCAKCIFLRQARLIRFEDLCQLFYAHRATRKWLRRRGRVKRRC